LFIPETALTGIYVGKFGGIYYEGEAFDILQKAYQFFGNNTHIILLTSYDHETILKELKIRNIETEYVHITSVKRNEVTSFLSAADFAFSFYRKSPSMKFLSPIKIGEYWANGLPVLIENGIGDDSEIVNDEGGGVIFDKEDIDTAFVKLQTLIEMGRAVNAESISKIAKKHRDLSLVSEAYNKILSSLVSQ
jgi:glycosyltransferase involved in cell wall biosynthesis